ncbi:hypothetical protein ORS3428_23910 [Mesorhizobium sp. ORS 3428]|nr:hypothetical protein ORS3428_23910 [Mesorhizobium sp. ORS 3428]
MRPKDAGAGVVPTIRLHFLSGFFSTDEYLAMARKVVFLRAPSGLPAISPIWGEISLHAALR